MRTVKIALVLGIGYVVKEAVVKELNNQEIEEKFKELYDKQFITLANKNKAIKIEAPNNDGSNNLNKATYSSDLCVKRGGRIPAPIHSLKN